MNPLSAFDFAFGGNMEKIVLLLALAPLALSLVAALLWLLRPQPLYATVQNITLPEGPGLPTVGTILFVANFGSPQTYLPVGNVGNMKIGAKNLTADVTNQGTPWKQVIATLHDMGTLTVDIHKIPGSTGSDGGIFGHGWSSGLGALMNGTITNVASGLAGNCFWKLVYPNGVTIYFTGPIVDFPEDLNLEKDIMCAMTIQISGEPVFTAGS